ncbi:MAG: integrase [Nitrosarchaeum sp.]
MEINPEEIIQTTDSPITLFYSALNNPSTKRNYTNMLKKIVCENLKSILSGNPQLMEQSQNTKHYKRTFSDADFEDRVNEFVRKADADPKWAESVIITLVSKLMEKTKLNPLHPDYIKSTMVENNLKPLKKLFDMNNIPMTWTRIYNLISDENDLKDKSRGYSIEEIQKIRKFCSPMEDVMVVLGACSGIRAGGFPLKWENIHPIYLTDEGHYVWEHEEVTESISEKSHLICGMLKIYADSNDEYFAFVTPEWLDTVEIYKEAWIRETNKIPRPEDPLFKRSGGFVRELKYDSIRKRMERAVTESGVRKLIPDSKQKYNIPLFNGLRRFFNKQNKKSLSKNSKLASLILKETMMGHDGLIKLDKNYFKEHIDELIEEYLQSVPYLTISNEERTKAENRKLKEEQSEKQFLHEELSFVKKELIEMKERQRINELKEQKFFDMISK